MSERQITSAPEGYSQWSVVIVAIFVTCLIATDITSVKLVNILMAFFGTIPLAGLVAAIVAQ